MKRILFLESIFLNSHISTSIELRSACSGCRLVQCHRPVRLKHSLHKVSRFKLHSDTSNSSNTIYAVPTFAKPRTLLIRTLSSSQAQLDKKEDQDEDKVIIETDENKIIIETDEKNGYQLKSWLHFFRNRFAQGRESSVISVEPMIDEIVELENESSIKELPGPSFYQDIPVDDPAIRSSRTKQSYDENRFIKTSNTYITASEAILDYLLTLHDLENMRKLTLVRSAHSSGRQQGSTPLHIVYLKMDVVNRALERWGSMEAIEQERLRRQEDKAMIEMQRKGIGIVYLHIP